VYGLGSEASGSGAGVGAIGSGAGAMGFGALRGAAFLATGLGAALRAGFAFAFLVFFDLVADFRAATFLRAPFAAALPRVDFLLAFLLVALAMLCLLLWCPRTTSRRIAEVGS
jgi:hypothetical protein